MLPGRRCHQDRLLATKASLLQEAGTQPSTAGDSAAQPAPKTKSYFLCTATFQCLLQRAAPDRDLCSSSEDQTQPIADRSLLPGTAWDTATEPAGLRLLPAAFRSTSPPVLLTRHWTNSSTNEIKPLTYSKAAEELTPAFSLLTVYFSVKHIIYSSIVLIIIYYRLEILSSFPYFNHIMNPILHTD